MLERRMQIDLLDAAAALSDADLIQHEKRMVANERQGTAQLVAEMHVTRFRPVASADRWPGSRSRPRR